MLLKYVALVQHMLEDHQHLLDLEILQFVVQPFYMQQLPLIFHLVQLPADVPMFRKGYQLLGHFLNFLLNFGSLFYYYNDSVIFNYY